MPNFHYVTLEIVMTQRRRDPKHQQIVLPELHSPWYLRKKEREIRTRVAHWLRITWMIWILSAACIIFFTFLPYVFATPATWSHTIIVSSFVVHVLSIMTGVSTLLLRPCYIRRELEAQSKRILPF